MQHFEDGAGVAKRLRDAPDLEDVVAHGARALPGSTRLFSNRGPPGRLPVITLSEVVATSDVPGGVVNVLTGHAAELAPWLAAHMDVNAIDLTGANVDVAELERLAADNVKRVVRSTADAQSPWEIESFLELKTVWHPIGL